MLPEVCGNNPGDELNTVKKIRYTKRTYMYMDCFAIHYGRIINHVYQYNCTDSHVMFVLCTLFQILLA